MILPALLAAAVASAAPVPAGGERTVEEVVAVVRNPAAAAPHVITLTKLAEEARVALVSRGAVAAAFQPLDAEALRATLEWLVDQTLVSDEAARLKLDDPDRAELDREIGRFRARFGPGDYARFLARSELSEDELAVTLGRMLRVQRYLENRVGRSARVADDEVDRYLREKGATLGSAGARDAVRAHLAEEKVRAHVKELLAELRARAQIRILDPLDGASRKEVGG